MLLPTSVIYYTLPRLQEMIANKVIQHGESTLPKHFCGIDVSYKDSLAFGTAVIVEGSNFDVIEVVESITLVKFPYVPGSFVLREGKPIMYTIRLLKHKFDLLLLNGHGMLHPRKCGLASFVGVLVNKPTIGIAKKLLCGYINRDNFIEIDRTICGYVDKRFPKKPTYISVGNRISLKDSISLVKKLTRHAESIPEPLRLADLYSKNNLKHFLNNPCSESNLNHLMP